MVKLKNNFTTNLFQGELLVTRMNTQSGHWYWNVQKVLEYTGNTGNNILYWKLYWKVTSFWFSGTLLEFYSTLCFNPNLGGLFRGSFWGWGGGDKITPPPCLKLVTIMLETSNLARKYTPICGFRKYTFLVPRPP